MEMDDGPAFTTVNGNDDKQHELVCKFGLVAAVKHAIRIPFDLSAHPTSSVPIAVGCRAAD
ncbi:MAG: hypothetical protein NVS4B5_05100 [Vulcanimicrobiaceae bacterium]